MSSSPNSNIALLVDYENVAKPEGACLDAILAQAEREGTVVLRRAYANWGRFASHKIKMRSAGFEMIDVASVNGKNSVDIKLVVDAMEIAYSKDYIDTFVIASGDSDFIPLVVKLNELNRRAWLHVPDRQLSPALAKFCFRMPGTAKPVVKAINSKIGPTIPNNSPVASLAMLKMASHPIQANPSVSLATGQLETVQTAIQVCDLVIESTMPLPWLVYTVRMLDPGFDEASCLGNRKRPFVRLGKHLHQLGLIELAIDERTAVYLFSPTSKARNLSFQPEGHPNFREAVTHLTERVARCKSDQFKLRPNFQLIQSGNEATNEQSVTSCGTITNAQEAESVELAASSVQLTFSF